MEQFTVLQPDAHIRSSLALIRSLGKRGIPVTAASHNPKAMGLFSRYVEDTLVYPSPLDHRREFIQSIRSYVHSHGPCLVLPCSDSVLLPLEANQSCFDGGLILLLPRSREHFEIAFDKKRTLELADQIGVETPRTWLCQNTDAAHSICHEVHWPVVVKPRHSVSWNGNSGTQQTAVYAFSGEELLALFSFVRATTGEAPLIQEYVPGEEAGAEFLCKDGKVLARCAHRRIRSVSPTGGAGAVTETVPLSYHGIGERAERLARALCWTGPIMVEFKISRASGRPVLMEINGRFWGSLPLAIAAGVDFPYLAYQLASNGYVEPKGVYQEGVVSRYFAGDLKNLLSVLFEQSPMRAIGYPRRRTALKTFFFHGRRSTAAIFDIHDIKPALLEPFFIVVSFASKVSRWWHARLKHRSGALQPASEKRS